MGLFERLFERFLSVWVALGICVVVGLGLVVPSAFQAVVSTTRLR